MRPVQNKGMPMSTTLKEYIRYEREYNLTIGERVRVCRSASADEGGWNNTWNSAMDTYVGQTYTITSVGQDDGSGINLGCFRFPYFILERVR